MDRRTALVMVSTGQLVVGVIGQAVAVRRRLPYDVTIGPQPKQGQPEAIVRDSWLSGTALSAPVVMLAGQAAATARLAACTDPVASRFLGALGLAMVGGYAGERLVRTRLRPDGWDPVESPTAATGIALAAGMVALGLPG